VLLVEGLSGAVLLVDEGLVADELAEVLALLAAEEVLALLTVLEAEDVGAAYVTVNVGGFGAFAVASLLSS
jgi:hypothetical protein